MPTCAPSQSTHVQTGQSIRGTFTHSFLLLLVCQSVWPFHFTISTPLVHPRQPFADPCLLFCLLLRCSTLTNQPEPSAPRNMRLATSLGTATRPHTPSRRQSLGPTTLSFSARIVPPSGTYQTSRQLRVYFVDISIQRRMISSSTQSHSCPILLITRKAPDLTSAQRISSRRRPPGWVLLERQWREVIAECGCLRVIVCVCVYACVCVCVCVCERPINGDSCDLLLLRSFELNSSSPRLPYPPPLVPSLRPLVSSTRLSF
ncbi:unnamed protein product [Protopolystoma xenopodis]|uniref:Uncharacterized protein n=1 Tax=Protopolystoma xenopodis TaxID=117903 RepID=A0A448WLC0_9PLAT|nr:unnamed protein product [Protopolystoma xenopodis]